MVFCNVGKWFLKCRRKQNAKLEMWLWTTMAFRALGVREDWVESSPVKTDGGGLGNEEKVGPCHQSGTQSVTP